MSDEKSQCHKPSNTDLANSVEHQIQGHVGAAHRLDMANSAICLASMHGVNICVSELVKLAEFYINIWVSLF